MTIDAYFSNENAAISKGARHFDSSDRDLHELSLRNHNSAFRASFVIWCSIEAIGQMRAHLLDVRTGNEYPLSDLNMLPELLERSLELLV
jgi:hypothetical protein